MCPRAEQNGRHPEEARMAELTVVLVLVGLVAVLTLVAKGVERL